MKLEKRNIQVSGSLGEETLGAEISQEDIAKLWDMFDNPYKDPVGSIVREIASNCFDAHAEAGVTDAIIIRFGKDEAGWFISFIDNGIGMDKDRIDNVYRKYLKSTKEDTNDLLGAFGIGSKSPLSYNNFFYINTVKDGVKHNMIMRKGETSPELDILSKTETEESNGTEVKIVVNSEADLCEFIEKCYYQLSYFSDIVFDPTNTRSLILSSTIDSYLDVLTEDFNIIEGEHFIYRDGNKPSNLGRDLLHISLGNVRYPIDFQMLGISRIELPVALKFSIGDLPVIKTREDIRYTDKSRKAIIDKIELLKAEFLSMLDNKKVANTLEEFEQSVDNPSTITIGNNNKVDIHLSYIIDGSVLEKHLHPIQLNGLDYTFSDFSESRTFIKHLDGYPTHYRKFIDWKVAKKNSVDNKLIPSISDNLEGMGYRYDNNLFYNKSVLAVFKKLDDFEHSCNTNKCSLYLNSSKIYNSKTNKYITEVLEKDTFNIFILSKLELPILKLVYKDLINTYDKEKARKIYGYILKELNKYKYLVKNYEDIVVPDKWWNKILEERKQNRLSLDYDRSLMAVEHSIITWKSVSYERKDYRPSLKEFIEQKYNGVRILLTKEEKELYTSNKYDGNTGFERLVVFINSTLKRKVKVFITSDRNYNKILGHRPEKSNIITLNEFMKEHKSIKTKYLTKVATILKIKNYLDNYPLGDKFYNDHYTETIVESYMNSDFVEDYKTLKHYMKGGLGGINSGQMEKFLREFDTINNIMDLYDQDIINLFNKNVKLFTEYRFHLGTNNGRALYLLLSTMKPKSTYYRFKLDWYSLPKEEVEPNFTLHEKWYQIDDLVKHKYLERNTEKQLIIK